MFINCYIYDYRTNIKTSRRNKIEYKCSNINKVNMTNPMVQKQNIEIKWLESFIKTQNSVEDMHLSNWKKIGLKLIKNYTFPSKNDEVWRFTDLKKLYNLNFNKHPSESDILEFCDKINIENKIIFENGKLVYFDKTLSENKMIEIKKFTELNNDEKKKVLELSNSGECGISGGFFSILNITSINDIYILKFNEDFTIETNINLISIGASNENQEIGFSKRLLVLLENKSEVKFNLINTSTKKEDIYFENSCINFYLKENSNLVLQNINNSVGSSNIMNTIHVDLNKGSFFTFNSISFGGDFERINIGVDMNGPESQCKLNGVFINHQNKIADIHSRISHNFPNCKSSQFQKKHIEQFFSCYFCRKNTNSIWCRKFRS